MIPGSYEIIEQSHHRSDFRTRGSLRRLPSQGDTNRSESSDVHLQRESARGSQTLTSLLLRTTRARLYMLRVPRLESAVIAVSALSLLGGFPVLSDAIV
jgi:hypothetical protein